MDELEQYREAVVPLRQADFGLVREAMGIMSGMSPTMALIAITAGNLLEIFDPHEVEECEHDWILLRNEVITSGLICTKCHAIKEEEPGPKERKKVIWFTCLSCGKRRYAYTEKRICPKCGGKLRAD